MFAICKHNPTVLEDAIRQLAQVRAQLPPGRLLPLNPTLQTIPQRLSDAIDSLREVTNEETPQPVEQQKIQTLLALADYPLLGGQPSSVPMP